MKHLTISLFLLFTFCAANAQLDDRTPNSFDHPLLQSMCDSVEAGAYEEITSILIAKKGVLVYEKYFQGNNIESKHNVRSGTKTIATLLVGLAIQQGYIASVEDPIMQYLAHKMPLDNPDKRKDKISIEDLLTMSSVMECDDNNDYSRGHEERMYIVEDWTKFFLDLPIKSYPFGPTPEESPYGRAMSYCSAGAATVSEVVQSAVKMKSSEFAEKELLKPLGITEYDLDYSPLGLLNTAGGSEYRSRDFMKFIQLLANDGMWNGTQLIPSSFVEAATSPKANAWEGMDYGYLMWLKAFGKDRKVDSFAMAGNGGNKIVSFPELDVTVVLTTTNYNNRKAHGYTDELLNEYVIPALLAN